MNNKNEIVEVFSGDLYQASMVKDLLESNGILVPQLARSLAKNYQELALRSHAFFGKKLVIFKISHS